MRIKNINCQDNKKVNSSWFNIIPKDWYLTKLKYIGTTIPGGTPSTSIQKYWDGDICWLPSGAVQNSNLTNNVTGKYITQAGLDNSATKMIKRDSILIALTGATCANIAHLFFDTTANQSIIAISNLKKIKSRYLFYIMISQREQILLRRQGGAQAGINNEDVRNLIITNPPLNNQLKIANFLDFELEKIHDLIVKNDKMIKLLHEKKKTIINNLITKGLNPNAILKDTRTGWFGKVPAHWDVVKLNYRYEVLLGKMLDEKRITGKYLKPYLRNTDVQWESINTNDLPMMDFKPHEIDRYSVKMGDLLVCEGGEIGRAAIWDKDEKCCYQKALHRLRPLNNDRENPKFLFYLMFDAVYQGRFNVNQSGKATIAHLPAESLRQYKFPFPPIEEQNEIVEKLNIECKLIDKTQTKCEKLISLLQEKRTALISAAVTGKIDVRDWKAPEGEEQ